MRLHTKHFSALVTAVLALGITACGGSDNQPATPPQGSGASAEVSESPSAAPSSVQLVWSHTGKFFDETQVWYVARVTNSGSSPALVTLNALALDADGVIVGSSQETLPDIPGNTTFDYFGYLGGGGALNTKLTGKPAKVQVTGESRTTQGEFPMLQTSEVRLVAGDEETYTDAPLSYNLSAKVTNTTGQQLVGGVTQQAVLYDRAGQVVGGDTGTSDNAPDSFPAGLSYRESWTGMPAMSKAARAVYTAWPSGPVG